MRVRWSVRTGMLPSPLHKRRKALYIRAGRSAGSSCVAWPGGGVNTQAMQLVVLSNHVEDRLAAVREPRESAARQADERYRQQLGQHRS
jgi:hypothetical protein